MLMNGDAAAACAFLCAKGITPVKPFPATTNSRRRATGFPATGRIVEGIQRARVETSHFLKRGAGALLFSVPHKFKGDGIPGFFVLF